MRILAIDPGPEESAYVILDDGKFTEGGKLPNDTCASNIEYEVWNHQSTRVVIEMIASYGMAVGCEVFETCVWIGRFMEVFCQSSGRKEAYRLFRRDVKMHLCGSAKANDANVRQALIDRFGPGKDRAVGTKKSRGPLYGVKGDQWAALAVAVTYYDMNRS